MASVSVSSVRVRAVHLLGPLAFANGVAVATLYLGQAILAQAAGEFGPSAMLNLMPGATLLGYAAGVAGQAVFAADLTEPKGLARHVMTMVAALGAAASAPVPAVLTLACLVLGVGCALTQRLLASATSAMPPQQRAQTIGWIIACGLFGIVLARATVPAAADMLGWRAVFGADATLAGFSGLAAVAVTARAYRRPREAGGARAPRAAALWRGEATLRRAAVQQAVVFAAYNGGWAIFPHLAGESGVAPSLVMGAVALLGASAALVSGRLCARSSAAAIARSGLVAVALAALALAFGVRSPVVACLAMGLLDAGTQIALVANQARAQARATSPAMRGRLTATVTTIGFAGGAVGSALGNVLASRL